MEKVFTKAKIRTALMHPEQIDNLFGVWADHFREAECAYNVYQWEKIPPLAIVNNIYWHLTGFMVVKQSRLLGRRLSRFGSLSAALAYCKAYCDERGYEYSSNDREFGELTNSLTIVRL